MTAPAPATVADAFAAWWRAHQPRAWPTGWSLREAEPRAWLRIHSLPDGRRGPDDDADWAELLARHRDVAITTLGDRLECWVVVGVDVGAPIPALVAGLDLAPVAAGAVQPIGPVDVDDHPALAFAVASCLADFDRLAPLVRACARGELGSLLMANFDPGQLYAPYEGGADLFFHGCCERDAAARRFDRWRSPRADGL